MSKSAVIFYYNRQNRYSINSLLGSLQLRKDILDKVDVYLSYTTEDLLQTLRETTNTNRYRNLIVCISFTSFQYEKVFNVVREIKTINTNRNLILICGGAHPTGSPQTALKLGFEICVLGEAEEVFIKLIERILDDTDWSLLPSIAFFDKYGNIVINKRNEHFVNLDEYSNISEYFNRYGPIEITRGCPYSCAFCQTSQIFGTKLRHRSISKICEMVETMASKGLYDTRFITPSLFLYGSNDGKVLNLEKLEELFKTVTKIIKPKGKLFIGTFPSEVRPEHINRDTVELLKHYADNDNIIIGAQSGSNRILNLCNRNHTVKDIYSAVELLTKAGFKVNLDFIFGLPYEEEKDVKETMKVINELVSKYKVRIHAHIFLPLVGTKFQNCNPSQNLKYYIQYCYQLKSKGILYGEWEKQLGY
ncbi:MAG: TIGR04013 family B12-binding domain/radical SAM domain-containing protein, partial [Endomicrobia bacterium]|nr:TIGR04013 family B12-binding domain/radical SAM domain-containing protein [Endomicrobiia bacterium]